MRILLPITEVSVIKPSWQEIFACLLTGVPAGSLPHVLKFLGALEDLPPLNPRVEKGSVEWGSVEFRSVEKGSVEKGSMYCLCPLVSRGLIWFTVGPVEKGWVEKGSISVSSQEQSH